MNDLYVIFLTPVFIIWGIFILLLVYAHQKRLYFSKKEKRSFVIILFLIVAVLGFFVFFEDLDFLFDCRKETGRCDYYHSTIYNKELRFARSFDLNGITDVEIITRGRRCGRACTKTVFRLVFKGERDSFEMPKDFDFMEDARDQAGKAAAFLKTDKSRFLYKKIMPENADTELFIFLGAMLSSILAFVGIFTILVKRFKR